jgi:hypothetical protein
MQGGVDASREAIDWTKAVARLNAFHVRVHPTLTQRRQLCGDCAAQNCANAHIVHMVASA